MDTEAQCIGVIGVPMDLGTHLRGVDMGPSAIRVAGLHEKLTALGYRVHDRGNLAVASAHAAQEAGKKFEKLSSPKSKSLCFMPLVAQACIELAAAVEQSLDENEIPLILGGDHSIAMGSMGGLARYGKKKSKSYGLLWIDAHGDCNTPETTPSGNIHGMPMAVALGHGPKPLTRLAGVHPMVKPAKTVLLAARDLDKGERDNLKSFGVRVYTMRELDERGVFPCMKEALTSFERRYRRISSVIRHRQPRSERRAGRRHAGLRRSDHSRGPPYYGAGRGFERDAQLRTGRSQSDA